MRTVLAVLCLGACVVVAAPDADPWIVALRQWSEGDHASTLATAEAHHGPDRDALLRHVRRHRTKPTSSPDKKALGIIRRDLSERGLDQIDRLLPSVQDPVLVILLHQRRAVLLLERGQFADAVQAFDKAARIAQTTGWIDRTAKCLKDAAFTASRLRDLKTMLSLGKRWEDTEQLRNIASQQANCFLFLLSVHGELGDYRRSVLYAERAEAIYRKSQKRAPLIRVLSNKAEALGRRGQFALAHAALDEARDLARSEGPLRQASVLLGLADLETQLGKPEVALGRIDSARKLVPEKSKHRAELLATLAGQRGNALRELGQTKLAIAAYRSARDQFRRIKDAWGESRAELNLGLALQQDGQLDAAERSHLRAGELGRKIHDVPHELHALHNLAELRLLQKSPAKALTMLGRVLESGRALGSIEILALGHLDRARAHLALGNPKAAAEDADAAVTHLLEMLQGVTAEQGARARARRRRFFEIDVQTAVALGKPARVVRALERGRAGALLSSLDARSVIRDTAVPAKLREAEIDARRNEAAARAAYDAARASRKRKLIRTRRQEVEAARQEVADAVAAIRRRAVVAAELLYPQPATLKELQAALGEHEALVLYGSGIAFVVTPGAGRLIRLPNAAQLDKNAAEFAHAAGAGSGYPRSAPQGKPAPVKANTAKIRNALRVTLIDSLGLSKKTRRLLVSPAGELFRVPFAALAPEYEIAYVPSGTTYLALRKHVTARGKGVLALGDPDYQGTKLPRLPSSRAEAQAVGTVTLLGAEATTGRLRAQVARKTPWRAVHLACHGLVDAQHPLRSALALAGGNNLTALEIYQWRVPAELVVLSACETGKGRIYAGEGLVGFTRAFLFAGPPRVIVSLWKVDDEATAALMKKFYKLWAPGGKKRGVSAAAALHQAQEHIRKQPKWQHPYYWAAWTLWGLPD